MDQGLVDHGSLILILRQFQCLQIVRFRRLVLPGQVFALGALQQDAETELGIFMHHAGEQGLRDFDIAQCGLVGDGMLGLVAALMLSSASLRRDAASVIRSTA